MTIRLPPLASLRQFEAAARHESFTKAAAELGLTVSAISHAVDTLEKWLGAPLFKRRSGGVTPTAAGQYFLPYVSEALSMIAIGAQRLPGRQLERLVSLSVSPTLAQRFLIPRLPKFRKMHPGIQLSIDTSHRQMLFPLDGVDLCIRMGRGAWPGTRSELLFRESLVPLGSPAYLASVRRRGKIDWSSVTLLHVSSVEIDWSAWFEISHLESVPSDNLKFDTIHLAFEAAVAGLGIVLGRCPLAESELRTKQLVKAADPEIRIDTGYWLVSPRGQETRTVIKTFRKWLMEEIDRYKSDTRSLSL